MSTSVSSVTKHFPSAENGFTTTTSGSVASGASVVGLNSVAGYDNGEVVVFVIDPTNSKKQTFTGVIDASGVQVTSVIWTAGTNQTHDAGATVVDWPSATHVSMISKGLLVEHNQDGTHGAVNATSVNVTSSVSTDTISEVTSGAGVTIDGLNIKDSKLNTANSVVEDNYTDGSIKPEHLMSGVGNTWVWNSYTPTLSGSFNNSDWTKTGKYTIIGKTCFFRIALVSTNSAPFDGGGSGAIFSLPTTAATHAGTLNQIHIGSASGYDVSTASYLFDILLYSSTTAIIKYGNTTTPSYLKTADVGGADPFVWGVSDEITIQGFYEVA